MADSKHIEERLNELKASGEINKYVHELLITRIYNISLLCSTDVNVDEAIRQELYNLNMEPGYKGYGEFMIPISRKEALADIDQGNSVYLIYPDDSEGLCDNREDIEISNMHFAYEIQKPQSLLQMFQLHDNKKMVYIASPLRGDYNANINKAVEYCRLASEQGILPMAPHIIFSQWCNDTIPELRKQGLELGLALLSKSEELWVMGTQISEGMKGEIAFAAAHNITTHYVQHPLDSQYYPISADETPLLCKQDCIIDSQDKDYKNQTVILRYDTLKPECRTPINQIWTATHGPGCHSYCGGISDTVHLHHPIDGDTMAVGRFEIYGIVKPDVLKKLAEMYPALTAQPELEPQTVEEQGEDMCI